MCMLKMNYVFYFLNDVYSILKEKILLYRIVVKII